MWRLKSLKSESNNEGVVYLLLTNRDYTVGRKDVQILIAGDPSISRKHAVLRVRASLSTSTQGQSTQSEAAALANSQLSVKDLGSKYGTYLNEDTNKLTPNVETLLEPGNIVTFGQLGSKFCVEREPLVMSSSCLDGEQKMALRSALRKLGGQLLPNWHSSCTHLIMPSLKVTLKAICALVSQRPIVTLAYLTALVERGQATGSIELPQPEDYLPPIAEPTLDHSLASFTPLPSRSSIFSGKTFICLTARQHSKLTQSVTLAGGRTLLWAAGRKPSDILVQPGTCVMQPDPVSSDSESSLLQTDLAAITALLKRHSKRLIPESDLGLAVVYCTTEKYCNPSLDLGTVLLAEPPPTNPQNTELLVPETQDHCPQPTPKTKKPPVQPMEEEISSFDFMSSPPRLSTNQEDSLPGTSAMLPSTDRRKRPPTSPLTALPPSKKTCEDNISFSGKSSLMLRSPTSTRTGRVAFVRRLSGESSVSSLSLTSTAVSTKRPRSPEKENWESKSKKVHLPYKEAEDLPDNNNSQHSNIGLFSTAPQDGEEPQFLQSSVPLKREVKDENTEEEEEILHNLTNIRIVNLVCRPPSTPTSVSSSSSPVKNFKAFKKVTPAVYRRLPRIIGGTDLVPSGVLTAGGDTSVSWPSQPSQPSSLVHIW